jgi:hypothetical protein
VGRHSCKRVVEEIYLVIVSLSLLILYTQLFPHRTDAKTVSIIALGCFHPNVKVQSASLHFFLGSEDEQDDSDDDDDEVGFRHW